MFVFIFLSYMTPYLAPSVYNVDLLAMALSLLGCPHRELFVLFLIKKQNKLLTSFLDPM